jgi:hypothetical protein
MCGLGSSAPSLLLCLAGGAAAGGWSHPLLQQQLTRCIGTTQHQLVAEFQDAPTDRRQRCNYGMEVPSRQLQGYSRHDRVLQHVASDPSAVVAKGPSVLAGWC